MLRRVSNRYAIPLLLAMIAVAAIVVADTIEVDFPDAGSSIYLISLPTTITTPTIEKAEDLLSAIPNGVFVSKFLVQSDTFLVYGDGPCRECDLFQEGEPTNCAGAPSQGGACSSACFCIDTSDGLGYFVKTSGPGSLNLDGTDGPATITLLGPGPGSNSGKTAISLPQDATATSGCELLNDIGSPAVNVQRWIRSLELFEPYPGAGNFPVIDGEGYIAQVFADTTYMPSTGAGGGTGCPPPCPDPACSPLDFDVSLESVNMGGGPFPLPLASDPGNTLPGDPPSQEGYGFVNSQVTMTLSSQRAVSPGPTTDGAAQATLSCGQVIPEGACDPDTGAIAPALLDGMSFSVHSFFDVFFDITVTDVDDRPGRDFAGQTDGASITMEDAGPTRLTDNYLRLFDAGAPNFGLIPPPESAPYIGHFQVEIPLGIDINGNAENDKIKFTLGVHDVLDESRVFITLPDGTVIDEFDSAASLGGAVVDESTDPLFQIGATLPSGLPDPASFGGPTMAMSKLLNPLDASPASAVPDGDQISGTPLKLAPSATAGDVDLSWGGACNGTDPDYCIYEGALGSFASHQFKARTTANTTSATITPASGNRYYLVVPATGSGPNEYEGSYGVDSNGLPRPRSASACEPRLVESCPR